MSEQKVFLQASETPTWEHADTVASFFMYPKDTLRAQTEGSYLEFVNEFRVPPQTAIEPHFHNSHEFYYILEGEGWMRVGDETRVVRKGDLIHTPPNTPHSLRALDEEVHGLAFAVSFQAEGESYSVQPGPFPVEVPDGA